MNGEMISTFICCAYLVCFATVVAQSTGPIQNTQILHHHFLSNHTIGGFDRGCKHLSQYYVTPTISFPMCMGQTDQDLKNGMSIINLVRSRQYLPTCRVLHLMLWMHSTVHERSHIPRDLFVDVGSNIGSCAVHMAALGLPVVAVEPVQQHVDTIQGTIDTNPSFLIELHHAGIAADAKTIRANFGHGSRNWGASEFHEVTDTSQSAETEQLTLKTLDQMVGHRRVALMKVDCEGCEWATLKGGRRTLRRTPMIKIEIVQPSYEAGNQTVHALDIIHFLNQSNFDLFIDPFNEQYLYFGNHGEKTQDIDFIFGSKRFNIPSTMEPLNRAAERILSLQIDPANFDHKQFLKQATDVIAIEKSISKKMKAYWLKISN